MVSRDHLARALILLAMVSSSMEILASSSMGILLSGLIGRLSTTLFSAFYLRRKRNEVKMTVA
jgi:hypothetical protein